METTNTISGDNTNLTAAKMLALIDEMREALPVVYYNASEHVLDPKAIYKIPDPTAHIGFRLVCHPSQVEAMKEEAAGVVVLLPHTMEAVLRPFEMVRGGNQGIAGNDRIGGK